jgi:hypothetical protein
MAALRSWDAQPHITVQRPGEILVLPPGSYWQGRDSGPCISEDMYYADSASAARAGELRPCSGVCCQRSSAAAMETTPLSWTTQMTPDNSAPERVVRVLAPPMELPWMPGDSPYGLVQLIDGARVVAHAALHFAPWQVRQPPKQLTK